MQVFQLYMIRFFKRIGFLGLIVVLPLLIVFSFAALIDIQQHEDFTKLLLSMVAILMIVSWGLTRLFIGDAKHKTNQRLLLGVQSQFKLFGSMIAFFVTITVVQLSIMLAALTLGTAYQFKLSWAQLLVLVTSYGMLTVLITGVSSLILHSRYIISPLKRQIIEFVCIMSLILGLLIPHETASYLLKPLLAAIPTQWIVHITELVVTDLANEINQILLHMGLLFLNCIIVFMLLVKLNVKTS